MREILQRLSQSSLMLLDPEGHNFHDLDHYDDDHHNHHRQHDMLVLTNAAQSGM